MLDKFSQELVLDIMHHLSHGVISLEKRQDFMYKLYEDLRNTPTMIESVHNDIAIYGITCIAVGLAKAYLKEEAETLLERIAMAIEDVICISSVKREEFKSDMSLLFVRNPKHMEEAEANIRKCGMTTEAFFLWDTYWEIREKDDDSYEALPIFVIIDISGSCTKEFF
jgi:hypothetical protein